MSFGDWIGIAGLAMAFVGIGIPIVFPNKRWIGWTFLGVGGALVLFCVALLVFGRLKTPGAASQGPNSGNNVAGNISQGGNNDTVITGNGNTVTNNSTDSNASAYVPKLPEGMTLTVPPGDIKLIFRSSPLFKPSLKRTVTTAMTQFRNYLVGLEIPVPMELPPIGTRETVKGNETPTVASSAPWGLPVYKGDITVSAELAQDPRQYTYQYCENIMYVLIALGHVGQSSSNGFDVPAKLHKEHGKTSVTVSFDHPIGSMPGPSTAELPSIDVRTAESMISVADSLSTYLTRSFWNVAKPKVPAGFLGAALWEIRVKYGRSFADQMIGFALRDMRKYPYSGTGNYNAYFRKELKEGESVVDNGDHWSDIESILNKHGEAP
jgi:hypothetical protein